MGLAETKHCYGPRYFGNIVWAAHDDVVRHFNMVVPYSDLQRARQGDFVQFPTTRLHDVARALGMQGAFEMQTLPRECNEYLLRASAGGGICPMPAMGAVGGSMGWSNAVGSMGCAPTTPGNQGGGHQQGTG